MESGLGALGPRIADRFAIRAMTGLNGRFIPVAQFYFPRPALRLALAGLSRYYVHSIQSTSTLTSGR